MSDSWCPLCGNSGIAIETGQPCTCKYNTRNVSEGVVAMFIPEEYRNIPFRPELIPAKMGSFYRREMGKLYDSICNHQFNKRNIFIGSPQKTGKTVFAYSCMQALFRNGSKVFPLFDVLQLRRILQDTDWGKTSALLDGTEVEGVDLLKVPILFMRLPVETTSLIYDTINTIVDRRHRFGNVTIMLAPTTWDEYTKNDTKKSLLGLEGDGAFGTIEVKSFWEEKN